jgi:hypothetical protein
MTKAARKPLRISLAEKLARNDVRLRAEYPQLYWDPDVLVVDQVAHVMRCSVDTVRRIPRSDLPYHRPGKHNLYFREDVLRYVRSRRVSVNSVNVDALLAEIEDAGNVTILPTRKPAKDRRKP